MTSFAEITGLLDRAQNPDALLTDGTRALTGHLSVASGITVDGVDISAFQSAYQAHLGNPTAHSYVRNILDDSSVAVDRDVLTNDVRIYGADGISVTKTSTGLRISGSGGGGGGGTFAGIKDPSGAAAVPDGFNYISLTVSNQVSITASTNALAFALVPGNINHQDLGGLGADDHHAAFVGLKVGATTINPDGSDVITIAAGTNATVVAGSNTVTIGVSSTPAFTSVTVSGNISVSGTVDGVDISTHAANANAHHNQQHALAGGDHTASGLTAGQVLRASGATTFAWAQLAHGDLSSIGTNTHAQIDTHIATGDTHVAHSGVSITAGAGLTGGGDLTANRTIALSTPGSLSATSTNSSSGSHTHVIDSTIARSAITISAGNGMTGGGDLTANRTIALSTPGSLSATSTNSATGNHTHVIDSSIARSAITISAGNGMSGGGNLTANRTLAVNQDYDFNWTGLHTFGEHTEMESVDVNGALTVFDDLSVFHGGFYPLFVNVDTVNPNNSNVGIMTNTPDPQFALDVAGPLRAQYLIGPHAIQLSDAAMIAHYDGPYPFETNFDGFAAGHLGQVATVTGGVIYRPGKFGKAVQLAEATTNLVPRPSFEGGTIGWGAFNGITFTVASDGVYGVQCASLARNGAGDQTVISDAFTVTSALTGRTFTVSFWWKARASGLVTQGNISISDGAFGNIKTLVAAGAAIPTTWTRVSATVTFTGTVSSTSLRLALRPSTTNGAVVLYDAVQVEEKVYVTPYCDGSLGTGHQWSGTAHASASSRTASTLAYNREVLGDGAALTLMGWINVGGYNTSNAAFVLQQGSSFANRFSLFLTSGRTLQLYVAGTGEGSVATSSATIPADTWTHFAVTITNLYSTSVSATIYINGVESGTGTRALTGPITTTQPLYVGSLSFSERPLNGLLDDLVILSRAADAAEIRSIYESNAPVFAESSIEVWRTPTQVPIWVDSEGLWMRAVGGGETLGAYGGDATKSWGGKTLYQSDFLLGNATNGYIHWHAFQNPADPYGAAGMEVKAQVDISGNSKISGNLAVQNGAGTVTYLQVTSQAMYVGGNINSSRALSAFFANSQDLPGAGPGGPQFDTGDLIIGEPTANHLLWDQSAGRFNFRDGTTLNSYIDDDGITMLYGAAGGHLRTMSDSTLIFDLFSETESSQANTYLNFFPISDSPGGNLVIVAHNAAGVEQGRVQFQDDGGVNFMGPGGTVVINKYTSINGRLDLSTGTGPLTSGMILHKLTTTQQNALTGVTNGMIIYNTTTNKFRGYAAGAWTDLH